MSKDKEKELEYLIYLKGQLIKEQKKELMQLRDELEQYRIEKYNDKPKKYVKRRNENERNR